MPEGMLLRSSAIDGCEIGEQTGALTLEAFSRDSGRTIPNPLPVETFVEYGRWYRERAVPALDPRLVETIERRNGGFELTLADGDHLTVSRVVVAGGIDRFAATPPALTHLAPKLVTHSSEHGNLSRFAGKEVAVIGAGQSALESAALLKEQGASVELIVRGPETRFLRGKRLRDRFGRLSWILYPPEDVGPPGINLITARPHILRRLPRDTQTAIGRRAIKPAGAEWLVPRVHGIAVTLGTVAVSAEETDQDRVHVTLSDGSERTVDHVIAATGFKVDIAKYPFLSQSLLQQIAVSNGYPVLARGFESSVPGLYFLGAAAAWSFGPLMRFVSGTWFTTRTLVQQISD
jgi:thioredoxin reductase